MIKEEIISALTAAGGRLPRTVLWDELPSFNDVSWKEYWDAEQQLVDEGRIERRQGRHGGIFLLSPEPAETDPERKRERTFYKPLLKAIKENWKTLPGYTQVFGAVTAQQGRRVTGGRWSRPDLTICTVSDWLFSSQPEGDVRTIEVKRYEALDVMAVYEALSHKARSHYAYLLIVNFPNLLEPDKQDFFDNVLETAARHGIGVITVGTPSQWKTWSFALDARRSDADSRSINQHLLDQVPVEVREQFRAAIRAAAS